MRDWMDFNGDEEIDGAECLLKKCCYREVGCDNRRGMQLLLSAYTIYEK